MLSPDQIKDKGRVALPYALLALVVFGVYSNAWSGDFVLDDVWAVAQNSFLRSWRTLPDAITTLTFAGAGQPGGFHRPVLAFVWFLTFQAFGLSAIAFHGVNIILHIFNALLIFVLGRKIGLRLWVSFFAALLWGVHPLQVEAVTYISGLGDLLYAFFCLCGLLVLLPDFSGRRMAGAAALFIVALGCKESAVVFPALATITLLLASKQHFNLRAAFKTWPLWLISVVYLAALFAFIHSTGFAARDHNDPEWMAVYGANLPNRIYTSLATVPIYFSLMLWPVGLHLNRVFPIFESFTAWPVLAGLGIVLLALAQIAWGRGKRGALLSWGLLWFGIAYSPNAGIVYPTDALIFEHWMYMPMIGLVLGLASLPLPKRMEKIAAALGIMAVIALGIRAHEQNNIWLNTGTVIESALPYSDNNAFAHNSLGVYYVQQGEFDKAAEQYKLALAAPELLPPNMIPAVHINLGFAYLGARFNQTGGQSPAERIQQQYKTVHDAVPNAPHIEEAITEFEKVLELNPGDHWAKVALVFIYKYQGNEPKAAYYDDLIKKQSRSP